MGKINTTPRAHEVWRGIGGHFDSLTQVLAEFIDNAVSNFRAHSGLEHTDVVVTLREDGGKVHVTVEDTGTGIADLEVALKLGDCSMQESPMSEHGFGIKHALATADPDNENWEIWTRTKPEREEGKLRLIKAPYKFEMDVTEGHESEVGDWPGQFNTSGTLIRFTCSRPLFETIKHGIRGNIQNFELLTDLLVESLGHTYSGLLDGTCNLKVKTPANDRRVTTIRPTILETYKSAKVTKDLGGGNVEISFEFLRLGAPPEGMRRYYQRSVSTSGVEIRSNGRLIEDNLFKEIWDKEPHPSYNHFKGIVNLTTMDGGALPRTRSSKNGYREGDEKLEKLFEWIRTQLESPPQENTPEIPETDLTEQLAEAFRKLYKDDAPDLVVETGKQVYKDHEGRLYADLFIYNGSKRRVYEMKKDLASVQDFYQLLMYWDGLVEDGTPPDEGFLVATNMAPGVKDIMDRFNAMNDAEGNAYCFSFKTWHDLNVDYPQR